MTDRQKLEQVLKEIPTAGTIHQRDLIRQAQRLKRKIRAAEREQYPSLSEHRWQSVRERLQGSRQSVCRIGQTDRA